MKAISATMFAVCLCFTLQAGAEGVYKYVKDGRTYYSDQPPPNVNAQEVESYSRGTSGPAPRAEETEAESQKQAIVQQECDKARARLVEYQNSPILIQRNLKGEEQELTAEERIDVIVRAQQDVNQLCGEPSADVLDSDLDSDADFEG